MSLPTPTLDTARLRLRPFDDADADDLYALHSNAAVLRYWDSPPWTDPARADRFLATCRQLAEDGTGARFAVERLDDGTFLGWCGLSRFNPDYRSAALGYCYDEPAWGHGVATEAARAVLGWAFATLDLHRAQAEADTRNRASARVLEKLGFVHEGTLREDCVVDGDVSDSWVYGLLRREWETLSAPQQHVDARLLDYYGTEFDENDRLLGRSGQGRIELERTQRIVGDRVPAGSRIIDIGGASGVHAAALAARGDHVLLVDPVPRHVDAAQRHGTFAAVLGDARALPSDDHAFDAALMLGPLYHLVDRADRLRAWREAVRVVRPGGWVFAAGVSRLSAMAWLTVVGPAISFAETGASTVRSPLPRAWQRMIVEGAGELGPRGFPGGHFHLADDLEREALDAGLTGVRVIGVEGPGAQPIEVARSHDPDLVSAALTLAEAFESSPGLRDLSPHLLAMGRTPG